MLIGATGRVPHGALSWPAALIVWGPGVASSRHAHHCIQLIFALRGRLRIRTGTKSQWRSCGAALIAADVIHEVDARGVPTLIAFVDPESQLGMTIDPVAGSVRRISDSVVTAWRRALGDPMTLEPPAVEAWVRSALLRVRSPSPMHAGIARVLKELEDHPLDRQRTSLARLAEVAALSQSRFMHLFTESTGTPLRPYVLWRRVQRAARALASGESATNAAHAAGFADAPHMTRTFRRMLGATPRELISRRPVTREVRVARSQFIQDGSESSR